MDLLSEPDPTLQSAVEQGSETFEEEANIGGSKLLSNKLAKSLCAAPLSHEVNDCEGKLRPGVLDAVDSPVLLQTQGIVSRLLKSSAC